MTRKQRRCTHILYRIVVLPALSKPTTTTLYSPPPNAQPYKAENESEESDRPMAAAARRPVERRKHKSTRCAKV